MKSAHITQGFTLIELLVAAALSLIITLMVLQTMTSTQRATSSSVNQASRLDDLQGLTGLIADDMRASQFAYDSLSVPTWTPVSGGTSALNLKQPLSVTCATTNNVSYIIIPRSALTGTDVSDWLRLPQDTRNASRLALVRAAQCNATVTARLVTDYLDTIAFALAKAGDTTFSTTGLAATGGDPYRAVEIRYAAARTVGLETRRVPPTGVLRTVATARAP